MFYEKLIKLLNGSKYFSNKDLFTLFEVKTNFDKQALNMEINKLVKQGRLKFEDKTHKYCVIGDVGITGKVQITSKGYGFFINDDGVSKDLFIAAVNLNGAMNNDKVIVVRSKDRFNREEAKIVRILSRSTTQVVGRLDRKHMMVVPDNTRVPQVFVGAELYKDIPNGSKVIAKITKYPSGTKGAIGKIVQTLTVDDVNSEIIGIAASSGNFTVFPNDASEAAKLIGDSVDPRDIVGRLDLRNELTFTIDGEDARDFDDAVSIEQDAKGNYLLGVHIADVSHYVKRNDSIDKEAFNRATSVYFPQLVLPMLPFELSNGICSLNPNVDRLTMTAMITLNTAGDVLDYKISNSVINSKARLTYNQVSDFLLNGKQIDLIVQKPLKLMHTLANKLIDKRANRGCLEFDTKEVELVLDGNDVLDIKPYERTISHKMIEEFMILANEVTAQFASDHKAPTIYRVHDKPKTEKFEDFVTLARSLGFKASGTDSSSAQLQQVLKQAQETVYSNIISKVLLRTMMKAKYNPINIGHYGLSSKCYCHFTSPIRRYPDLVVHRSLKLLLDKNDSIFSKGYAMFVSAAAEQATLREKQADEAEREVDDMFKAIFARKLIGQTFDGVVSGTTEFGIFVELHNTVEGLVKVETLPTDNYRYDEVKHCLLGRKNSFSLGDKVKVLIVASSVEEHKVEMQIV